MSARIARARHAVRCAASSLVGLLAVSGCLALSGPVAAAPGEGLVAVQVVRDYDGNGSQGPGETHGVAGLIVTLEDDEGDAVTATTDASGVATLDPQSLAGGTYRVRTEIPAELDYLKPAPAGGMTPGEPSFDALVTYVTARPGVQTSVLQGLWNPFDFAGESPRLLASASNSGRYTAFRSGPIDDLTILGSPVAHRDETGNGLYGIAYDRNSDRAFLGAYTKRHTVYGPAGGGGIYVRVDASGPAYLGKTDEWVRVPNTGTTEHGSNLDHDDEIFDAVGREGLGDIQLSEDGSRLYVVNLFNRSLYTYDTADASIVSVTPIPVPASILAAARADDWRPFGLGVRDGVLYVGGVDSAEHVTGSEETRRAALRAIVYTFEDGVFSPEPVLEQPLGFARGLISDAWDEEIERSNPRFNHWSAWRTGFGRLADWTVLDPSGDVKKYIVAPQPILSDIAVDDDGSLILAFKDRTGDQWGNNAPAPEGNHVALYEAMAAGDVNRACKTAGGFAWEGTDGCPNRNVAGADRGGQTDFDIFGDRIVEFYPGDYSSTHQESSLGSVLVIPGTDVLGRTEYTSGASVLELMNGTTGKPGPIARFGLDYVGTGFGKAGGIGAIAMIASAPIPVQMGNRTWFDANRDGIQDPTEPPLAGVEVRLVRESDGETVATTTTDGRGLYYFGPEDGLTAEELWTLEFDYTRADLSGAHFEGRTADRIQWTTRDVGDDEQVQSRVTKAADSTIGRITGISLSPGEVDHTLDAGVRLQPEGSFILRKSLDGVTPDQLPDGTAFEFTYSVGGGAGQTAAVSAATGWAFTAGPYPAGTTIDISEVRPLDTLLPNSLRWTANPTLVAGADRQTDNSITITIGADTDVAVQATNHAVSRQGSFTLTKRVVGPANAAQSFRIAWWVDGVQQSVITLTKDAMFTAPRTYPIGTKIEFAEQTPAGGLSGDDTWGAPVWSGATVNSAGRHEIEITENTGTTPATAVTVTNPVVERNSFTVAKSVQGEAADAVPDDAVFMFEYLLPGDTSPRSLTVTKDDVSTVIGPVPTGTVVRLREVPPSPDLLPSLGAAWSGVRYFNGAARLTPDPTTGYVSFTVTGDSGISIEAVNDTRIDRGTFSITKEVAGIAAPDFDVATDFTVEVQLGDEDAQQHLVTAGKSLVFKDIPVGTRVRVSEPELDLPELPTGFVWATPKLEGPGSTLLGVHEFTISNEPAAVHAVTITNTAREQTGSFELAKEVTGGSVPDGTTFTVDWWVNDVKQTTPITIAHGQTTQELGPYRVGTKITLREGSLPDVLTGDDLWGTPVFTGVGLTRGDDGAVSFEITSNEGPIQIDLENPITDLSHFSVAKQITGPGEAAVPANATFDVEYTVNGGATHSLVIGEGLDLAESIEVAADATIRLRETSTRPDFIWEAARWGTPTYRLGGADTDLDPDEDGWVEFQVGGDAAVSLQVDNPTSLVTGRFSVEKQVAGIGAPGATYQVGYSASHPSFGQAQTGTLALTVGTPVTSDRAFPIGTVVTLTEVRPGNLPAGVVWTTAKFSDSSGAALPRNQLTIVADPPGAVGVAVTLTNTFERPSVDIEKGDDGFGGDGSTLVNDADTMADGQYYRIGESRTIVFTLTNNGTEPLVNVQVTDRALFGGAVENLQCVFPDDSTAVAVEHQGVWTVTWAATFGAQPVQWMPDATFDCTATLTATAEANTLAHVDSAAVTGIGVLSRVPVTDWDNFNEFTADIQVIKYDGTKPDPEAVAATPGKPLVNPAQDANDRERAVRYAAGEPQAVRWVVTNMSATTYLTDVRLWDETHFGAPIGDWSCDLRPIDGPAAYSFVDDGNYAGLWAPGVSFFCEGALTLPAVSEHADTVHVDAAVVVPDDAGDLGVRPGPSTNPDGTPRIATVDGEQVRLTDSDPFHARTPDLPPLALTGAEAMKLVLPVGLGMLLAGGLALLVFAFIVRRSGS